jgi:uncharacterized membrane protein
MHQKDFLATLDQERIRKAIETAEKRTSGEIRVHIQPTTRGADIRTVAEKTFERLGMTRTAERNGVLLFVACEELRQFFPRTSSDVNELTNDISVDHH